MKDNDTRYDYRSKYVKNFSSYYLFSILFVENTLTVTLHSSIGQTCIELFWRHFVSATLLLRFKHFKVLCSLSLHLSQITCSNQVTFEIYYVFKRNLIAKMHFAICYKYNKSYGVIKRFSGIYIICIIY